MPSPMWCSLNVDLNEITMNLVPFPKLHFLIPSLAPLCSFSDVKFEPRSLDQETKGRGGE